MREHLRFGPAAATMEVLEGLAMVLALVGLFTLVLIFVLVRYERRYFITEYLFFIRYPILLGIVLAVLPYAAPSMAPDSLTNLFVLNIGRVGVVSFFACFAAWSVVHTGRLIWLSTPSRVQLAFDRRDDWWDVQDGPADGIVLNRRYFAAATLLALPVVIWCVWNVDPASVRARAGAAAVAGMISAGLIWVLGQRIVKRLESRAASREDGQTILSKIESRAPRFMRATLPYHALPASIQRMHVHAIGVFVVTAGVYIAIGILGRPSGMLGDSVPALAYVLILFMILAWVLGAISFVFDRSRVPGVSLVVLLIILGQAVFPNTHYYRVQAWAGDAMPPGHDALHKRWVDRGRQPMVVVACSGGGITASLWTAIVLEGLHQEIPGFGDRVSLVSSVSGGGIGALLYADSFTEDGPPSQLRLDEIVGAAGTSNLDAATWGIAYPDLWRFIIGTWNRFSDRGKALEHRWASYLSDARAGFSAWAPGVREGWRPIQVFNVAIQESGGRLLLAPADLSAPGGAPIRPRMRKQMADIFEDGDVAVVTAARLSAAFPYVAPQARADECPLTLEPAFHCADGGYFDVSGMFTAMEVVGDYLASRDQDRPQRIAIIEIRAAVAADAIESAERASSRGGLVNAILGPVTTLYNARAATQIARNAVEFEQLETTWADEGVAIQRFVFHLSDRMPLSWNLTAAERERITAHWPRRAHQVPEGSELEKARKDNAEVLDYLVKFLTSPTLPEDTAPVDPAQYK